MRVDRFEDLDAWQLAKEVNREVFSLTGAGPARSDRTFLEQIRDSSASAPRNISEGFGRYRPAEFANKVRIALGELRETDNSLIDGRDRGYFPPSDVERIRRLIERAVKVATGLHSYLEGCVQQGLYEGPRPHYRRNSTRKRRPRKETNDERTNDER